MYQEYWLNAHIGLKVELESFDDNGNPIYNAIWTYLRTRDTLRPPLLLKIAIPIDICI